VQASTSTPTPGQRRSRPSCKSSVLAKADNVNVTFHVSPRGRRERVRLRHLRVLTPKPYRSASRPTPAGSRLGLEPGGPRWGRNSAAPGGQQRTAGDNERRGQRLVTALGLGRETAGLGFHTAEAMGTDSFRDLCDANPAPMVEATTTPWSAGSSGRPLPATPLSTCPGQPRRGVEN
jgi:hypothetical protein